LLLRVFFFAIFVNVFT